MKQKNKSLEQLAEEAPETRQFRRRALILVALVMFGYGGFKFYQVSIALNIWKQQTSGTDHRGAVPPNQ